MRVIAGELRGRRLHAPAPGATRPTSDRARAGLFDWLGACVQGARVLDLFAGTGALGIEALSRGAREVTFVERAAPALRALRRNLRELGLEDRARVLALPADRALARLAREAPFDLVLADPPYGAPFPGVAEARRLLELLSPEGHIVVERSRRDRTAEPPAGLARTGTRAYGETEFERLERKP